MLIIRRNWSILSALLIGLFVSSSIYPLALNSITLYEINSKAGIAYAITGFLILATLVLITKQKLALCNRRDICRKEFFY